MRRLLIAVILALTAGCSTIPAKATIDTPISEQLNLNGNVAVFTGDLGVISTGNTAGGIAVKNLTVSQNPNAILHLGDLAYEYGSLDNFTQNYDALYGSLKPKIRPAIGNHEYGNGTYPSAPGYFGYFSNIPNYYSWNLVPPNGKTVHFLSLNSNCQQWNKQFPGCGITQAMRTWIREDLAADHSQCRIATWHEPAFGSQVPYFGDGKDAMRGVWETLETRGVDYVVTAHAHNYQRYRRLNHLGQSSTGGIASAIVGTGGKEFTAVSTISFRSSLAALDKTHNGVLKMVFNSTGTGWTQAFKATNGATLDTVAFGC